ncbi:hypothetical protein LCGC14_0338250 [marine sediment metagenome]|uniref:Uncharacterized protein n=1 Tax=marine sediment metagenome TaxID=412755 RepID=A0A0F9W1R7_9ZZZZ
MIELIKIILTLMVSTVFIVGVLGYIRVGFEAPPWYVSMCLGAAIGATYYLLVSIAFK